MNTTLKEEFKLTNDGDHWGNVMAWLFAIGDYITFETDECIPDTWQFKPSPCGANEDCDVFQSLRHFAYEKQVTNEEILHFGNLLMRVRDILESKGESY